MRRGQAEILGLVLIVVMIVVGFLFYARFTLSRTGKSQVIAAARETQLGQTFVTSLALTDLVCDGTPERVETLVRKLALGQPSKCDPLAKNLTDAFGRILNNTLKPWGVNYRFYLARRVPAGAGRFTIEPIAAIPVFNNTLYPVEERCTERRDRTADMTIIPLYSAGQSLGQIELRLEQCSVT